MELTLASAAAPDLPLADLLDACVRRGFAAVELEEGHAHGVGPEMDPAALSAVAEEAALRGVRIRGFRAAPLDTVRPELAVLSLRLGVPVIRSAPVSPDVLREAAQLHARAGTSLVVALGGDAEEIVRLHDAVADETVGFAWEVRPAEGAAVDVAAVIRALGPSLRSVRLHGGGPEAQGQTGMGVGALMAGLALARYGGPLVLAPSTPAFRRAWASWLGSRGGWGCGSKAGGAPLPVSLPS